MKYTVLFQHTCSHKTWGDDPNYATYPEEFRTRKVYGDQAGKPFGDELFMMVVTAANPLEAQRAAEADALNGSGTIILFLCEGALVPIIKNDLVIVLRPQVRP